MMAIAQQVALEGGLKLLGTHIKAVPMAAVVTALKRVAPLASKLE